MAVSIFHSTADTPNASVSQYLGQEKRKQAPYEILNLLYNLWCLFCFKEKLQMQVDGAWEKDIKTTVCVCVRARSPETGAWLTLEIDGVTVSSPVQ